MTLMNKSIDMIAYFPPGGGMPEPKRFRLSISADESIAFDIKEIRTAEAKKTMDKQNFVEYICVIEDHEIKKEVAIRFYLMDCKWELFRG